MKAKVSTLLAVLSIISIPFAQAADADVSKLAAANNAFAFKLLKQLSTAQPKGTIFVSPYSAATALQMAANGAGGETKAEMQKVLETSDISAQSLNEASKAAAGFLKSTDKNVILTTANALWYRQGSAVKRNFLAENQKFFSSTVKPVDFQNAPAAEAMINQWAREQTHGRIDGIANGMIDPTYTDMVLANAIYFKGRWKSPFDPKRTKDRLFYPAVGEPKNLPMMGLSKKADLSRRCGVPSGVLALHGESFHVYLSSRYEFERRAIIGNYEWR